MSVLAAGSPSFALATLLLSIALSAAVVGLAWSFERRSRRLPEATRFEGLAEKNAAMEVEVATKRDELRQLQARIDTRDRLAAEALVLQERVETLKMEFAGLDSARAQIEEVKLQAAEAAMRLAEETAQLDEARQQAGAARADRDGAAKEAEQVRAEARRLGEELAALQGRLPVEISELTERKVALEAEIERLRPTRDALLAARDETTHLAARNENLRAEIERAQQAEHALRAGNATLAADREALGADVTALRAEVDQLRPVRDRLLEAREELRQLAVRLDGLRDERQKLQQAAQGLQSHNAALSDEHDRLASAVAALRFEQAALGTVHDDIRDLESRRAALEEQIATLRRNAGAAGADPRDAELVIRDLRATPDCVTILPPQAHPAEEEETALHQVLRSLAGQGLKFDPRTVYAFHTSLKINEVAQMAVLAGVSGTGKSLLPRCYAEAMGIGFLQIAVEPRWDSPQDLLGFYNYIEQRYRATDLARLLVRMDPYDTSGLRGAVGEDRMMLVLLDEMNLARVEYYFSEFLSRLEVRPRLADVGNAGRRQSASLTIDIPGRADAPIKLFPSHNVLFAGTMNDDESTQALSDKVLDRGNVLQFAAPSGFARPATGPAPGAAGRHRSFAAWQRWLRPIERMDGAERAHDVIGQLAGIMESFGRPFGHRLNEAMLAYVANYPRTKGVPVTLPLADQIEMRILPKLRGLPLEDFQGQFEKLAGLIRRDADDDVLATRLEQLIASQRQGVGQFSWRGLTRDIS